MPSEYHELLTGTEIERIESDPVLTAKDVIKHREGNDGKQ